jgi:hypothetical protein
MVIIIYTVHTRAARAQYLCARASRVLWFIGSANTPQCLLWKPLQRRDAYPFPRASRVLWFIGSANAPVSAVEAPLGPEAEPQRLEERELG